MARKFRLLIFVLQFALAGLAAAFLITLFWPGVGNRLRARLDPHAAVAPAAPSASGAKVASYAAAVANAAPAVVNIYADKVVIAQAPSVIRAPILHRLLDGMGPARKRRERSLGSGVIFTSGGYILTNNHVIAGAINIQVVLHNGRVAHANVVGTDPDTDLAVLKIDAGSLPTIKVARKPPRVGDVVLAIGNPYGIGQTVTMGIVSALGRRLSLSPYEGFIQTDAAINSGNSGGALINARGQLVGISTAILGHDTGAQGIGFAIPVDTAQRVLQQIIEHGHVVRGWMGVEAAKLLVPANSGLPAVARGAVVVDVYPGGPAAKAGLQAGDVLLTMNGEPIIDPVRLRARVVSAAPGSKVKLSGLRAGHPFHTEVVLATRPAAQKTGQRQ